MPTYVEDADALAAWSADAEAMFPPIAQAIADGQAQEAVRRLIDASGGGGHFDRQPEEVRAVHLDNAGVLPLLFGGGAPPAQIACGDLGRLVVPAAIAWGSRSRPLFAIPARAAASCVGGGAHREIEGAGHLWPEQDPAGFSDLVAARASAGPEAQ